MGMEKDLSESIKQVSEGDTGKCQKALFRVVQLQNKRTSRNVRTIKKQEKKKERRSKREDTNEFRKDGCAGKEDESPTSTSKDESKTSRR